LVDNCKMVDDLYHDGNDVDRLKIKINLDKKNMEEINHRIMENKRKLLRLMTLCPNCGCDLSEFRD